MVAIHEIASGVSNNVDTESRKWVDYVESIGKPSDAKATAQGSTNSAFSLLKGIAGGIGIAAGSGAGDINNNANVYADLEVTLGLETDAAATDAGRQSAISLLKGICAGLGL